MSEPRPCAYDEYYYAHDCGRPYQRDEHWLGFFGGIADRIVHDIAPRTALDAGCAMGFLVESLRDKGVEAYGLDISDYALQRVREDIRPYCRLASVLDPLPQRYDLIVCIEVLEHLSPREAELAVANLCAHTDDVLFSSTPVDYREATHVNVQPPEQWAELFARQGLFHDVDYDAGFITQWAARFRRRGDPVARVVRNYERRLWLLQTENAEVRLFNGQCRAEIAALEHESSGLRQKLSEGEAPLRAMRLEKEQALRAADARLAQFLQSRSWRLAQAIQRLWSVLTQNADVTLAAPGTGPVATGDLGDAQGATMPVALTRLRGLRARLSGTVSAVSPARTAAVAPTYDVTTFAAEIDLASLDVIRWAPVWMTRAERLLLYTLTFCLRPTRYLEIGTLEGGSALIVSAAMDALHSDGRLICVDPEPRVTTENWERLRHRTHIVKGYSPQALSEARSLSGGPFDLVLIDGDHTAMGVERDATAVLPLVADEGYLLFHDSFFRDVAAGIDRFVDSHRLRLIDLGTMTREVTTEPKDGGGMTTWGGLRLVQVRP